MPHTKLTYQVVRENVSLGKSQMEKIIAKEMRPFIPMVQTTAEIWQRDKHYDHLMVRHTITRNTQEEANKAARDILKIMRSRGHDIDIYQAEDPMGMVQFSEETEG